MSAFNEFDCFLDDLTSGVHNFNAGGFMLALTNLTPDPTSTMYSQIIEIPGGFGYTSGGLLLNVSKIRTGSTITILAQNALIYAQGGVIGPFQYAVLYNSNSPNKSVVGWWDYGMPLTLQPTEAFTFVPNPSLGLFSIARAT